MHTNKIIVKAWNHRLNWGLWRVKTLESRLWRGANILCMCTLLSYVLIARIYWVLTPPRHCGKGFTYIIFLNSPKAQWRKALLLPVEHTCLERWRDFLSHKGRIWWSGMWFQKAWLQVLETNRPVRRLVTDEMREGGRCGSEEKEGIWVTFQSWNWLDLPNVSQKEEE